MDERMKPYVNQTKWISKPDTPPSKGQLFAYDCNIKGAKLFIVTSYEHVYRSLPNLYYWYEDHTHNTNIRLHIDVDYHTKYDSELERDEDADVIIGELTDLINDKLLAEFKITNNRIIVLISDTLNKLSLHFIYLDVLFKSIIEMNMFMDDLSSYVDMRVYRRGVFRMPENKKFDKDNKLIFYASFNYQKPADKFKLFLDSCICSSNDGTRVDYSHKVFDLVPSNKLERGTRPLKNHTFNRLYHYPIYDLAKVKKALESLDGNLLYDYKSWLAITTAIKDLWIGIRDENHRSELYNIYDTVCQKSAIDYLKNNPAGKFNYDKDDNYRVFHNLNTDIIDINYVFSKANMKYFIHPFYDYKNISFNINNHTNIIQANETFINPEIVPVLATYKNIFIKSPTGTGKTTLLEKLLSVIRNSNVLSIISRVNLASVHIKLVTKDSENKDVKLGLEFYQNLTPETFKTCDKLVIQLESIIKCNYKLFKDATIILDETNSLLSHLRSPTFDGRRASCYKYLVKIIKDASHVICMDADLCNDNIEFIKQIRNSDYIVYHNVCKNKTNTNAIFYNCYNKILKNMEERIKNKQFFVACFDTLAMMNQFLEHLSKFGDRKEWKIYSSEESKKNPNCIINTADWLNRFVFYTPSILYGIDFSYKEYIVDVFSITTRFHLNPMQVYQMMTRTRHMNTVHVYCHENLYYLKYKSKDDVIREFKAYERFIGSLVSGKERRTDIDEEPYKTMYFSHKYMDALLKTNIKGYLIDMMMEKGFTITYDTEIIEDVLISAYSVKEKINDFMLDNDGTNAFEKELLSDPKKLDKHYNLMMFLDNKYNKHIIDLIEINLLTESIKNKSVKIKIVGEFMKDLQLDTFDKFNINVISRFTEPFIMSPWLTTHLPILKNLFDIRGKKYDTIKFYNMYQLLTTLVCNLFGSDFFSVHKKQIKKVEYFWYEFKNSLLEMHQTAQQNLDILHANE